MFVFVRTSNKVTETDR